MAKILDMPKLSPTMEEGVLSAWHKKEGDAIAVDDLLAEVETDKATMEFRAFDAGTLLKILVPPGSQVKLGQPVAIVGSPGEDVSAMATQAGATATPPPVAPPPDPATPTSTPTSTPTPTPKRIPEDTLAPQAQRNPPVVNALERTSYAAEPAGNGHGDGGRVMASPYVRKVARELGVDLQGAQGTGPGGRVVPSDLESMRGAAPRTQPLSRASHRRRPPRRGPLRSRRPRYARCP